MKEILRRLFLSALADLSPDRVIAEQVSVREGLLQVDTERLELAAFRKILVISLGKAAYPMARTFQRLLKPRTVSGVLVSSEPPAEPLPYMMHYQGGHPYPNAMSVRAAEVILELLRQMRKDYLVVFLLSGGGSAIVEKPLDPGVSLADLQAFYKVLVTCGANIVEINTLRKHFSATKGGRLAAAAYPARQVTLYISDVPANRPSMVASGPTMPDESTIGDCREIIGRLHLLDRFPPSIRSQWERGNLPETPKPGDPMLDTSSSHLLMSNERGVEKLLAAARQEGWIVECDVSVDDWPVPDAAAHLLSRLAQLRQRHRGRTVAVVTGGELSSPVTGNGLGGRNQAFVLACAERIGGDQIAVLSGGTDGLDGNSPAAGAVADGNTLTRAAEMGLSAHDAFLRSDSYGFFATLGDAVITGPTGNNIRDLRILVAR